MGVLYQSLYRRYRPQTFMEVTGQKVAVDVISRSLASGKVGHAYLFSGPRGCGKTTVARLLAKAVNCSDRQNAEPCNCCESCRAVTEGRSLDVVEIDGASNNTVDEIRELKANVGLASFGGRWKVYIIDEVHMLSQSAFNALLKTLEEPPEQVMFVLATTEPHKVPPTIRSRCQHIPFHGMAVPQIVNRLKVVSQAEGMKTETEALWEIARNSDGGMRDGLSLLEQAVALGDGAVTVEAVQSLMGGGTSRDLQSWISLCHSSPAGAQSAMDAMLQAGAAPERLISGLFDILRNLWLLVRWGEKGLAGMDLSDDEAAWLRTEGPLVSHPEGLETLLVRLAALVPQVRRGLNASMVGGLLTLWTVESFRSQSSSVAVARPAEAKAVSPELQKSFLPPPPKRSTPAEDAGKTGPAFEIPPKPHAEEEPSKDTDSRSEKPKESGTKNGGSAEDAVLSKAIQALASEALDQEPVLWAFCRTARFSLEENELLIDFPDAQQVAWEAVNDRRILEFRDRLHRHLPSFEGRLVFQWRDQRRDDSELEHLSSGDLPDPEAVIPVKPSLPKTVPDNGTGRSEVFQGAQSGPVVCEEIEKKRSLLSLLSKLPQAELLSYRREDDSEEDLS